MWYVKDEFTNKIYFKSSDLRLCQTYVSRYNKTHKFMGQRMFKFNLYSFCGLCLFWESYLDICHYTYNGVIRFNQPEYSHPFAVKNFNKKHKQYLNKKFDLIRRICKKYHLWSYNEKGRKCDGFDF